jgi:hypothetical protein
MDPSLRDIVGGALTLNRDAFVALVQSEHPIRLSTTLLVLIGLSWMLGHCAVLFLNRVPPRRFVFRTLGLAGSFILGALLWVGSAWLVASVLPGNRQVPFWNVIPLTAFAYAPLVLSAFIIIPYIGSGIEAVLNTWTLLALVLAMSTAFEMGLVYALLCAGGGWLLTRFLPRLAGGRLNLVFNNAWYRVNSAQVRRQVEEAAAESVNRMRRA